MLISGSGRSTMSPFPHIWIARICSQVLIWVVAYIGPRTMDRRIKTTALSIGRIRIRPKTS